MHRSNASLAMIFLNLIGVFSLWNIDDFFKNKSEKYQLPTQNLKSRDASASKKINDFYAHLWNIDKNPHHWDGCVFYFVNSLQSDFQFWNVDELDWVPANKNIWVTAFVWEGLVKTQLIIILFKREAIKPPTKHIICDGCNNTPDTRHVYKHKLNIHILELMLKRLFHKLQIISIREIWNHVQALNRVGWLVNRFVKPYQQTIKHFTNTTVSHQSPSPNSFEQSHWSTQSSERNILLPRNPSKLSNFVLIKNTSILIF